MVTYKRYDIVKVPFPFTDKPASKYRPALVLSSASQFNSVIEHSVMAMITSAKQSHWPLDTPIDDLSTTGLSSASIIRLKLFTLDHRLIVAKLGTLSLPDQSAFQQHFKRLINS